MAKQWKPTIALFTSGGDASGMNAALRAIVRLGLQGDAKVYAVYEGYQGLVDGLIEEAHWGSVSGILAKGGTVLGSARCQAFRTREGRLQAAHNLVKYGVNTLIVIGGDGSLTGADVFRQEWSGLLDELEKDKKITCEQSSCAKELTIIGLVGSIDNDMCGTECTIGADSALHRIAEAIDAILSTARSHKRTFVVEVMGRDCGFLGLYAGLATGADWVFIPEMPPEENWQTKMIQELEKGREMGRRCSLVLICEGARDRNGQPITSNQVLKILTEAGHDARITILGHVQRGGTPSAFDRNMSTIAGAAAIEAAFDVELKGQSWLIGTKGHKVIRAPLMGAVEETRSVAKIIANKDYEKAVKMRGVGFEESLKILYTLHSLRPRALGAGRRSLNIAVLHSGALAAGMNATVRALVRLGLDKGHKMFGVKNGFEGLIKDNVTAMDWMSVNGWSNQAGAYLGISRDSPVGKLDKIAGTLKKYNIDALIMVGGFDGYKGMHYLYENRTKNDGLDIAMICIPATISNNCPGTETSIGADTALNNIVDALDKIKESAVASRRVFVVEVMGGNCGYLALMSSLASGAERAYLPEEGITLATLAQDVEDLKRRFKHESNNLGLIIRSENANKTFTTDFIHNLMKEEGKGLFDVRQTILGHLQQGGKPTPFDRILGSRIALHVINFLDDELATGKSIKFEASVMFGVENGGILKSPLATFNERMSDERRPLHQQWIELSKVNKILGQFAPHSGGEVQYARPPVPFLKGRSIPHITNPMPKLEPAHSV